MTERMLLELGAQIAAGQRMQACAESVGTECQTLVTALSSALPSFKGAAAAGLSEALNAWLQQAADLPQVLASYASSLAEVDVTAAASDSSGAERLNSTSGGASVPFSPLNLSPGAPR